MGSGVAVPPPETLSSGACGTFSAAGPRSIRSVVEHIGSEVDVAAGQTTRFCTLLNPPVLVMMKETTFAPTYCQAGRGSGAIEVAKTVN
jgi:hypothetical protein